MKRIALAGIKHCGKSTLGKLLADRWGIPFHDSDVELEKRYAARYGEALSCREIYRQKGEEEFRRLEAEALKLLAGTEGDRVIALGGGALSNRFLPEKIRRQLGTGVWVDIRPEIAFERVKRHGLPPFLAEAADPFAEYCRINREREEEFRKFASHIFPVECEEAPETVAARLAQLLQETES